MKRDRRSYEKLNRKLDLGPGLVDIRTCARTARATLKAFSLHFSWSNVLVKKSLIWFKALKSYITLNVFISFSILCANSGWLFDFCGSYIANISDYPFGAYIYILYKGTVSPN